MPTAVAAGLKFILFHMPAGTEIDDIAAYLNSMTPVRSPKRNPDGSLSTAAKRGKAIFERPEVGCAKCHPAPLFTDLKSYDVGTKGPFDAGGEFDTPTLVEGFRTAPYLHDGSAITMREALKDRNKDDNHGKTSQLSPQELHDLIEYVLSL
jgi:cytochrome c peroxidase